MTIAVLGTMRFPADSIAALRPHVQKLAEATRANDGCICYDVAEDLFDPGLLRFSELWPDQASLDAHLTAPHIAPWRAACGKFGIMARDFSVWDAGNPRPL